MEGRFPSHLLLSHSLNCTAEVCVAGCPVKALDLQSGIRKSGQLLPGHKRGDGPNVPYGGGGIIQKAYGGDSGYASRYYQQFRPTPDNPRGALLSYLTRLITPPGGIVLDPLGNNEDLQSACQDEGFTFIGIVAEEKG